MTLTPTEIERILREVPAAPAFPPYADRAAWQAARERLGAAASSAMLAAAEQAAAAPVPPLPASLWLECRRTGRREGYEDPCYRRRLMLRDLALGECLEGQGRFLDPLMDVIWAMCEETSWCYPAHEPDLPDPDQPYIDLGAAGTAFELATAHQLLAAALPPEVGRRVAREADRRVLAPFLARDDWWWLRGRPDNPPSNWTAVCSAGVMAAALLLEPDPARLAAVLAKGAAALDVYLGTFDPAGGTSEGPGYWSYGFGHYTLIAHLLEQRTAGRISLLDGERVRQIASFPLRALLGVGQPVTFSDTPRRPAYVGVMLAYLGRRLALPGLLHLAAAPEVRAASQAGEGLNADFAWRLRGLFWEPAPAAAGGADLPLARCDWFPGLQWMIARAGPPGPAALALAAKGGHNDELHNHNDLGSFIVQAGGEPLVVDPGAGRYTLGYFGPERYQHFAASSLGHAVPRVNGQLQAAGRQYAARVIEFHPGDEEMRVRARIDPASRRAAEDSLWVEDAGSTVLRLDLTAAYPPEAGLARLERRLALHRAGAGRRGSRPWVALTDRYAFAAGPGEFESALITFAAVTVEAGAVLLRGERAALRVTFDPAALQVRVEHYPQVDLDGGPRDVTRVVFAPRAPAQQGEVSLRMTITS